jgi:hypothetical protein
MLARTIHLQYFKSGEHLKSIIFWYVTPSSLVEVNDVSEERVLDTCLLLGLPFDPEYGSSKFVRNIGKLRPIPANNILHSHLKVSSSVW